jgi:hypothetical protein
MLREDAESLIRTDDTTVPLLAKDPHRPALDLCASVPSTCCDSPGQAVAAIATLDSRSRRGRRLQMAAAVHRSTPVTANSCNRLGILELSECADCERPDLPKRPAKQSLQSSPRPVG